MVQVLQLLQASALAQGFSSRQGRHAFGDGDDYVNAAAGDSQEWAGFQGSALPNKDLVRAGTRVLVFLVREQGGKLLLRLRRTRRATGETELLDVLSGTVQAGEGSAAAAARVLLQLAGLHGPPETEFLVEAGSPVGSVAAYVALVRAEPWLLRGHGAGDGGDDGFVTLDEFQLRLADQPSQFAAGVATVAPTIRAFLSPWVETSGGHRPAMCTTPWLMARGAAAAAAATTTPSSNDDGLLPAAQNPPR